MFDKILIANRGEIACRIIRTAARLGVRTVAVYSQADAAARHVALADEAVEIGPAPARESYLRGERIIEAARVTGAEAIHPGYGFLSENAGFAAAVAAAGMEFIGPPPAAIRAMGDKSAAKALMSKTGVPVVPGYHGDDQDPARLLEAARTIGWPVLIKASAGGGGKGMRIVAAPAQFAAALGAAQREARAAFGDDRVLIERYLDQPRHIEIQVFFDRHGHGVHLFERDCSIQRRHQKVIEEAPAPGLAPERRAAMGAAALEAGRAIGYVGAGTVELIADRDGEFYFMEMNTRLQVEHPVTEMITGQDLVEWQLRVAAGEPLPCAQDELAINGWAFEARIYAEDPDRDFLPATGHLRHLRFPLAGAHVRIDTGVRSGDTVSVHYDPMIAKLIVWDRNREAALRRLQSALRATEIVGVTTNVDFLATLAAHPAFAAGEVDTGFIARHRDGLLIETATADDSILALACLDALLERAAEAGREAERVDDRWSPWHRTDGWRLNEDHHHVFRFASGATEHLITVHFGREGYLIDTGRRRLQADATRAGDGELAAILDGIRLHARVLRDPGGVDVLLHGAHHRLVPIDPTADVSDAEAGSGSLTAPMPGTVIALLVEAGSHVTRGTPLLVLEAMKMEHTIKAPSDGTVTAIHFATGDSVPAEGVELLVLEPDAG
ncbi:MAG: acetyl/propionyl/methylcrotonyl-CoA carboxylase subunit alpha [Gammaproteobacteria bacterium]|nr:acetyl/propionyl/methylcrotonyl-CoA carboxylase subunit alpha [Gammaproteobacteria bacterium]